MLDQAIFPATIRTISPVEFNGEGGRSYNEVGSLLQHDDGTYELSLAVIPGVGSHLQFRIPGRSSGDNVKSPIRASISGHFGQRDIVIGEVSVTGSEASAVFWGTPGTEATFLFDVIDDAGAAGSPTEPELAFGTIPEAQQKPTILAVAKFDVGMIESLLSLATTLGDGVEAHVEVTDRGLWFAHPVGAKIFLGSLETMPKPTCPTSEMR